jgi:L-ascorbate metabolism protein UlaG (beta-lactamase superfamily)
LYLGGDVISDLLYLRRNVQVEPLVDSWYAWAHLIPPATSARNLTERQLPIMDSYISGPQVHAEAVKNPALLGGPFIDYGGKRVEEISALRDRLKQNRSNLIDLSNAINALDAMLRDDAKGSSLEALYLRVPDLLRGYVELVYDLNHNPSFRIIETLLYKSEYYNKAAQSIVLSITSQDDRPFVLSTPRLKNDHSIHLPISFDDERIDWLFRLKTRPASWEEIRNTLQVVGHEEPLLRSMFTDQEPPRYQPYDGPGVRWRYFGHACILVETAGSCILFDPVLSYTYESDISRYTYDDLPDVIDFVAITHNHQDHILFETLLQIRNRVKTFVVPRSGAGALQDPSIKLILENIGCKNVVELNEMQAMTFEGGQIIGLPFLGEHGDLNIPSKLTYFVKFGQKSLLFLADSCNIDPAIYEHVRKETGDIDAIFLGMECDGAPLSWIYGPLLTKRIDRAMDKSRRLAGSNCNQALSYVDIFKCKEAYVYAMGQEPWLNYIMSIKYNDLSKPIVESNHFIKACQARGVCAERLFGEKEILL